jgi:hypothetical protein
MNHYTLETIGRDHELELLKEAEHRQLVKLVTTDQPGAAAQLLGRLGGLMIKIGGKLQKRPAKKKQLDGSVSARSFVQNEKAPAHAARKWAIPSESQLLPKPPRWNLGIA